MGRVGEVSLMRHCDEVNLTSGGLLPATHLTEKIIHHSRRQAGQGTGEASQSEENYLGPERGAGN